MFGLCVLDSCGLITYSLLFIHRASKSKSCDDLDKFNGWMTEDLNIVRSVQLGLQWDVLLVEWDGIAYVMLM
jgi:hypothetical protein